MTVATEPKYQYGSTQVNLEPRDARRVMAWAKAHIPTSILAADGYETEPHITVKYGIEDSDPGNAITPLRKLFAGLPAIVAKTGKVGRFSTNPDFDVLYLSVISPDLANANKRVRAAVTCTDTHPTYTPHITLAYVKKGAGKDVEGRTPFADTLTFRSVWLSDRGGGMTEMPLSKTRRGEVKKAIDEGDAATSAMDFGFDDSPKKLASNPAPTASPSSGRTHQETIHHPNFLKWFGDWRKHDGQHSAVLNAKTGEPQIQHGEGVSLFGDEGKHSTGAKDESDDPRVLYHGTTHGGFKKFDDRYQNPLSLYGPGHYFTENKEVAKDYAGKDASDGDTPEVKSVYLNVRKPLDMDNKIGDKHIDTIHKGLQAQGYHVDKDGAVGVHHANHFVGGQSNPQWKNQKERLPITSNMTGHQAFENMGKLHTDTGKLHEHWGERAFHANALLRGSGYDGITHVGGKQWGAGGKEHHVWIAFHGKQVKHTENSGDFNPNTDDMYKAVSAGMSVRKSIVVVLRKALEGSKLPQDHARYFNQTDTSVHVPVASLSPDHRHEGGVLNAEKYMRGAYNGTHDKRNPIDIEHDGKGGFKVMNGNSTFAVARAHGWSSIPARVHAQGAYVAPVKVTKAIALRKAPVGIMPSLPAAPNLTAPPAIHAKQQQTPASLHEASGPKGNKYFTHQEMSQPNGAQVQQHTGNPDELYGHAVRHKGWLDNTIDKGNGVGSKLGFHIVDGRPPTKEDFAEGHKKGGMVVMAPLKGRGRFNDKVRDNYGGDDSKMMDVSRATIAVRHPDDLPHVTHALRQAGLTHAAAPEDRFTNPTDAGYMDVQAKVHDLHKHIGELQLHTLDHLEAKELGYTGHHQDSGHAMYETMRSMKGKDLTPEDKAHYENLRTKSAALYNEASNRVASRTPLLAGKSIAKAVGRVHTMGWTYKNKSNAEIQRAAHEAGRPGYYTFEGMVARRKVHNGYPEVFHSGSWHQAEDVGKFEHGATRITESHAHKLLQSQ